MQLARNDGRCDTSKGNKTRNSYVHDFLYRSDTRLHIGKSIKISFFFDMEVE